MARLAVIVLLLNITCGYSDDLIIVTDILEGKIWSGPIESLVLVAIPLHNVSRPTAVDYDPIGQMVYWTDTDTNTISRAYLNNGTNQEIVVQMPMSSVPEGLAIDIENRLLYWTDNGTDTIEKSDLNGRNKQTLFHLGLQKPRAIVVDSNAGYLYWTDWGSSAKIERGRIDGSDRTTLVGSDLQYPNGLAIDYQDQRLYWCDAGLDRIEFIYLNGSGRSNIYTGTTIHPFDIGVYNGYVYWSDWLFTKLVELDKESGFATGVGQGIFRRAGGLHIFQDIDECQQLPRVCDTNADCTNTVGSYMCQCKDGFFGDGTTCEDTDECQQLPSVCDTNAKCINTFGSYTCQCKDGFSGDGTSCTDINECLQSPFMCDSNADCANTVGSFLCQCKDGFLGDGKSCTEISSPETTTSFGNPKSSTTIPSCIHPGSIEHGHVIPTDSEKTLFLPREKVTFSCDKTYFLVGDPEVHCLEDLSWSGYKPTCKLKDAGNHEDPGNNNQHNYVVVGAMIGGILAIFLVVIIACALCFLKKERHQPAHQPNAGVNLALSNNHLYDVPNTPLVATQTPSTHNTCVDNTYMVPKEIANHDAATSQQGQPSDQTSSQHQVQPLEDSPVRGQPSMETGGIEVASRSQQDGLANVDDSITESDQQGAVVTGIPCTSPQLIKIPVNTRDKLALLEKWRNVLHKHDVHSHLKPILTVDYLSYFLDMTIPDQEEITSTYKYHPQRAADVFIEKLSRMELKSANRLLQALCADRQHDVHKYLYELLMEPIIPGNNGAAAVFPTVETPDMSDDEISEQQLHRSIWTEVVRSHMIELRSLPFNTISNVFSNKLRHFDSKYANDFEAERRNKGETRAVEWFIRTIMRTESRWPEALVIVLEEHNKPLLNKIKREFRNRHQNSDCVCSVRDRLPSTEES
ncbi:uncharacterized protein [Amphiura filiformis]|uniref:uncharacterized protein isoform X2 n=1 Tax=Amphiura filiformis TaxID=82378 RepID=UPI003B21AF3D